jgi:hypothetical protein
VNHDEKGIFKRPVKQVGIYSIVEIGKEQEKKHIGQGTDPNAAWPSF